MRRASSRIFYVSVIFALSLGGCLPSSSGGGGGDGDGQGGVSHVCFEGMECVEERDGEGVCI